MVIFYIIFISKFACISAYQRYDTQMQTITGRGIKIFLEFQSTFLTMRIRPKMTAREENLETSPGKVNNWDPTRETLSGTAADERFMHCKETLKVKESEANRRKGKRTKKGWGCET